MAKQYEKEFKTLPHFVKAVDGDTVTGVFSVFGVLDSYADNARPGMFMKTFAERGSKTLFLWQHDFYSPPIANITDLREIGREELPDKVKFQYPEAEGGAQVTRTYLDTARAREVLAAIKSGVPLQMSFGYDPIRYEWKEDPDSEWGEVRDLLEVRLWEVSDVNWGANAATVASKDAIHTAPIPIEILLQHLDQQLTAMKAGRRNAANDLAMINQIAELAYKLGATSVVLASEIEQDPAAEDGDKQADPEKETKDTATEITGAEVEDGADTEHETDTGDPAAVEQDTAEAEGDTASDGDNESADLLEEKRLAEEQLEAAERQQRQAERQQKAALSLTLLGARLRLLELEQMQN